MKPIDFIELNVSKYYAISWYIPSTYFTKAIVLKTELFNDRIERFKYLDGHKKFWFEYLPFVKCMYFIGKES